MESHSITGNDIVKRVAELRSTKYPELKSVAEFEWKNEKDLMEALRSDICNGDEGTTTSCYYAVPYSQLLYFYLLARGYDRDILPNIRAYNLAQFFIEDRVDTVDYTIVARAPTGESYITAARCRNNMFTYLIAEEIFVCWSGYDVEDLYCDLIHWCYLPSFRCNISQHAMVPISVFESLSWDNATVLRRGLSSLEPSINNIVETIK